MQAQHALYCVEFVAYDSEDEEDDSDEDEEQRTLSTLARALLLASEATGKPVEQLLAKTNEGARGEAAWLAANTVTPGRAGGR